MLRLPGTRRRRSGGTRKVNLRRMHLAAAALLLLVGTFLLTACQDSSQSPTLAPASQSKEGGQVKAMSELSAVSLSEGEKLRVIATTNIVADVVANVGGDRIELTGLLPAGADPHTYQPTPQDLLAAADAHAIFINGVGLEAFLNEMLQNAGSDAPVIPVSQGVKLLEFNLGQNNDEHQTADPHTWFDPNNVIVWVRNIEQALSRLDPAHAKAYEAHAEAYIEKLQALDMWIREQVAQIPEENRKIVTDHRVFAYFADAYGFEVVGAVIEASSMAAEPSAQELAVLENKIRQHDVPAAFVGRTANPKLAERVAEDTGIKLVALYTGSLSEAGGEADSYIEFMQHNVSTIVKALGEKDDG